MSFSHNDKITKKRLSLGDLSRDLYSSSKDVIEKSATYLKDGLNPDNLDVSELAKYGAKYSKKIKNQLEQDDFWMPGER